MFNTLYNEACAYAEIHKDKAKAIQALQDAVKTGYADLDKLSKDSSIELVRDTAEFKKLFAQVLEQETAPKPKPPEFNKN